MANIVPDSFKLDLLTGFQNFNTTSGNTYYLALYTTVTGFSSTGTTAYTTTNEASGTGYTAGGTTLTISTATVQQDIAFVNFSNATFSTATLSASACLIYNTTNSKKAVVVLDFTTTQTATNGSFTIQFPAANSTSAILRIN